MDDAYKVYASPPSSRHLSLSKLCGLCFRFPAIAMADVEMKPADEEKKAEEEKKEEYEALYRVGQSTAFSSMRGLKG